MVERLADHALLAGLQAFLAEDDADALTIAATPTCIALLRPGDHAEDPDLQRLRQQVVQLLNPVRGTLTLHEQIVVPPLFVAATELARRAAKPVPPRVIAFVTQLNANPGAVTDEDINRLQIRGTNTSSRIRLPELLPLVAPAIVAQAQVAFPDAPASQAVVLRVRRRTLDEGVHRPGRGRLSEPAVCRVERRDGCNRAQGWDDLRPAQARPCTPGARCRRANRCSTGTSSVDRNLGHAQRRRAHHRRRESIRQAQLARQQANEHPRYALAPVSPTSWSPFDYLKQFYAGCCAFLGVDESHNTRGDNSDIARAIARAKRASQSVCYASGTHYAGSLELFFRYWFRFAPDFWLRLGYTWKDSTKAILGTRPSH